MTKKTSNRYSPEVRQRAVRMVLDHGADNASQWSAIGSIAAKIGCTSETLRGWVRQAERDQGLRPGPTSAEGERIKALARGGRELRLHYGVRMLLNDKPQRCLDRGCSALRCRFGGAGEVALCVIGPDRGVASGGGSGWNGFSETCPGASQLQERKEPSSPAREPRSQRR